MAKDLPRLFDQLTRPGATYTLGDDSGVVVPVDQFFQQALGAAVRVVADGISEFYWLSSESVWDLKDDRLFGSLRMPFPSLWIEWLQPSSLNIDGDIEDFPARTAGVLLEASKPGPFLRQDGQEVAAPPWPVGTVEAVQWTLVNTLAVGGMPIRQLIGGVVGLDDAGRPTTSLFTHPHVVGERMSADRVDITEAMVGDVSKVAFVAISFMNYANVTLEQHPGDVPRATKKQRRPRSPGLTYRTINLPRTTVRTLDRMREAASHGVPLHLMRAHHKTYTAERPLFGKYVGKWLWGWQVRGDPEHGIVVSDYEVGLPPD